MRVMVFHHQWKIAPVVMGDDVLPHVALITSTHNTDVVLEVKVVRVFYSWPPRGFKIQLDCVWIKACQLPCKQT